MIVVTAPTGNIGSQVLRHLLDADEAVRVIARDPAKLPPSVRGRVEVVAGSHGDADVVDRAFDGADAVFWLPPSNHRAAALADVYVGFTRPACAALERRAVKRVVGVSALGRGWPRPAGQASASWAMDDLIAATGVSYRALALPGFMDNMLRQVESIRTRGTVAFPISGDRKLPTCATRDIAAVAARLLLDPTWTGTGSVAVLGPEDLSFDQMAAILSEVLGIPVRFEQMPFETLAAALVARGTSEAMAQAILEIARAKDQGMDNAEPRTPQSTTPTSFRQWCQDVLRPAFF